MGKVVSVLSSKNVYDIFLDLENAKPNSPSETKVYNDIIDTLEKGPNLLANFENYKGCDELIKVAISKPSMANEDAAWKAVTEVVGELKNYFYFSKTLQDSVKTLILALTQDDPLQSLGDQQALAKLLADTIVFVLRFDETKMKRHQLQNDFSYYRRMVSRKTGTIPGKEKIGEEICNRMSLFFASSDPMLQAVADKCRSMASTEPSEKDRVTIANLFSTMCNVCLSMLNSEKLSNISTRLFCLRCMTGSIIIFDHVHPSGAFGRKSQIKIKQCINILKSSALSEIDPLTIKALLGAIKFSSLNFNKQSTPSNIRNMIT